MSFLSSIFQYTQPIKTGFDIIRTANENPHNHIIINSLPENWQDILIAGTLPCTKEEERINTIIDTRMTDIYTIVIYGKNASDDSVNRKYHQLHKLGFVHVIIYAGGMFEYLLLQDIFGIDQFPIITSQSSSKIVDLLKYGKHDYIA
jgi:hypothetical protein